MAVNSAYGGNSSSNPYSGAGVGSVYSQYGLDPNGTNETTSMFKRIAANDYGAAASNDAFGNSQNYGRQQAIQSYLNNLNPANLDSQRQTLNNQIAEQGAQGATTASMQDRAAGLGDGFTAGNIAGANNQAAGAQAKVNQTYASPEFQQQALQAQMGGYQQAYQNPELQTLMSLWSPIESGAQFNQSTKTPNMFGQLAGAAIGGLTGQGGALSNWLSGLGGSSGGSGGASPPDASTPFWH